MSKDPTYLRSFLVTLGLGLCALGLLFWEGDGLDVSTGLLVSGLAIGGLASIAFGLFGPSRKIEPWAVTLAGNEVGFLIFILAAPLYLVLSPIYRRR